MHVQLTYNLVAMAAVDRPRFSGPLDVCCQLQHSNLVQPPTVSPISIPQGQRQQIDRSAVVLVDVGLVGSNGEHTPARLLPRYRKPKRQRKRAVTDTDNRSILVPLPVVVADVTSRMLAVDNLRIQDGDITTTTDDDEGEISLFSSEKRCIGQRLLQQPEARPLLFQQQDNIPESSSRNEQQQRHQVTASVLSTIAWSVSDVGDHRLPSDTLTENDRSFPTTEKRVTPDQRRNCTTTASIPNATARHHWRHTWSPFSGIVSSQKQSDSTDTSSWCKTARSNGGSNQRSGKDSDRGRGSPSSFEPVGTKHSKTTSDFCSNNYDDARDLKIQRVVDKAQPLIDDHKVDVGKCQISIDTLDEVRQKRQLRRQRCVSCCRKLIAFLFSTVGSCCVLVGYVIIGGLMFRGLEAEYELRTKNDMRLIRLEHIQRLWNVTEEMNVLHPDTWSAEAERILNNFTTQVKKYRR